MPSNLPPTLAVANKWIHIAAAIEDANNGSETLVSSTLRDCASELRAAWPRIVAQVRLTQVQMALRVGSMSANPRAVREAIFEYLCMREKELETALEAAAKEGG